MPPSAQGSTAKAALREELRDKPVLWPPTASSAITDQVLSLVGNPKVTACYLSYGDEAPTVQLRQVWRDAGVQVMLPFLMANNDLDWVLDDGSIGYMKGFTNPGGQHLGIQSVSAAEVIVLPTMAVGVDGVRLGQGGGSYDRSLARVSRDGRILVALAHESRVYAAGVLPAEHHDVLVDAIVTPQRVIRCVPRTRQQTTTSYMQHLLDEE